MSAQPFLSPEELASFYQPETPPNEPPKEEKNYLTADQASALFQQHNNQYLQDVKNETNFLKGQLAQLGQQLAPKQQTQTQPQISDIPLKFDDKGFAIVPKDELSKIINTSVQDQLNQFKQNELGQYVPAVQQLQKNQSIEASVNYLKQTAPELLEGQDPHTIGKMALDLYASPFNNGVDEMGKTNYAINELKKFTKKEGQVLPISTGSGQVLGTQVMPYNQTGRTQAGNPMQQGNPWGFQKGQTINIKAKSINDLGGLDQYKQYVAQEAAMHEYNKQFDMGWTIKHID